MSDPEPRCLGALKECHESEKRPSKPRWVSFEASPAMSVQCRVILTFFRDCLLRDCLQHIRCHAVIYDTTYF